MKRWVGFLFVCLASLVPTTAHGDTTATLLGPSATVLALGASQYSEIPHGAGSAQEQWLRGDLAASRSRCRFAPWYKPRFTWGGEGLRTGARCHRKGHPRPPAASSVRGIFDSDFSASGFDDEAAVGFNVIDSGPEKERMDALAARGLKGMVWLGDYSNTTCTFNESDDWIRSHVSAIAGNAGVGAYFITDEPDPAKCPNAPHQVKARSDLVKSIDARPPTFMVDYKVDQFKLWAGKTDILGLNHYPCSIENGCDYSKIDEQAAEANRLGIRYWGVLQAFGDDWYKVPTPEELHEQFVHWRGTAMEGYLVFAWRWPRDDSSLWLANHRELQSQLAVENGSSAP